MAGADNEDRLIYRVPRQFRLLDELERAEKGQSDHFRAERSNRSEITAANIDGINFCTLGLDATQPEDAAEPEKYVFTNWNATIIPHQGASVGNRLYSLKVTAGPDYPNTPPSIRFVHKVNLRCVNHRGEVNISQFMRWDPETTEIFLVLLKIRDQFQGAAANLCAQIPDGTEY